jgi:hypothetical protein
MVVTPLSPLQFLVPVFAQLYGLIKPIRSRGV